MSCERVLLRSTDLCMIYGMSVMFQPKFHSVSFEFYMSISVICINYINGAEIPNSHAQMNVPTLIIRGILVMPC